MASHRKRTFAGLAQRARSRRLELGLSQQVAATRAGMSMNRLRDLELHGLATLSTITKLSSALGVSVDELTGRRPSALAPGGEP
ncbi:MAG: helix-turn-helix domain-containing protein [Archangium sp.]